jgi:hypothetical protein
MAALPVRRVLGDQRGILYVQTDDGTYRLTHD